MGLYSDQILPRAVAWAMGGESFRKQRPRCVGAAEGRVLELGFGSGHNLPFYSAQVTELFALEPSALARKLAAKKIAAAPFPVELLGLEAERIPLPEDSVDCVASTWTLCTIGDLPAALAEVRRVLVPGGRMLFLEHGLAREPKLARWQNRLNPLQKLLFGGCHLNRRIDELVRASGFEISELEESFMEGAPRFAGYLYCGVASVRS